MDAIRAIGFGRNQVFALLLLGGESSVLKCFAGVGSVLGEGRCSLDQLDDHSSDWRMARKTFSVYLFSGKPVSRMKARRKHTGLMFKALSHHFGWNQIVLDLCRTIETPPRKCRHGPWVRKTRLADL